MDTTEMLLRVQALEGRVRQLEAATPDATLPPECLAGTCGYDVYLGYNTGAERDLPHRAYHAQERLFEAHAKDCRRWERGETCSTCLGFEKRLRA
jgi:hypothetical protein